MLLFIIFSGIPDLNYKVGTLVFKRKTLKPRDTGDVSGFLSIFGELQGRGVAETDLNFFYRVD